MKHSELEQEKSRRRESLASLESQKTSDSKSVESSLQRPSGFHPKAGQWVSVRPLSEIVATLDQGGALDGLSFMPEMIPFCGRRFRVKRFANKTCVSGESNFIGRLDDCVVLQTPTRCDGSAHQGCEMGCQFFWKTEWLLPGESDEANDPAPTRPVNDPEHEASVQWLTEKALVGSSSDLGSRRYRCQATELVQIAQPIGPFKFKQYVDDHRRDKISVLAIGSFLFSLIAKKLQRKSDNLVGPNLKRTPTQTVGLELGERVRVKALEEIRKTLDVNGCNRGLWFDPQEMGQYCEQELIVSRKITKMIDEKTGKLRIIKQPTVVLSETECSGVFRRFCSRGSLHFWREIWLERAD